MYFIDESGSVPTFKSLKWQNRYFVIAFVHTNDPEQVKKVHKTSLKNVKKYYPHLFQLDGEIKASDSPPFIKEYLINRLLKKTDINIGYIVVDNWNTKDSFREDSGRSFNYLIKLVMSNHQLGADDSIILMLKVDNRNVAIGSLRSLEDYLFQELVLNHEITRTVDVQYCNSANFYNIQVADLMANTIYQYYRYKHFPFPNINSITAKIDVPCSEVHKHLYNLISSRIFYSQEFPFRKSIVGVPLR